MIGLRWHPATPRHATLLYVAHLASALIKLMVGLLKVDFIVVFPCRLCVSPAEGERGAK